MHWPEFWYDMPVSCFPSPPLPRGVGAFFMSIQVDIIDRLTNSYILSVMPDVIGHPAPFLHSPATRMATHGEYMRRKTTPTLAPPFLNLRVGD